MIVELVKAAVYVFPFVKELFLGKDKDKKPGPRKGPQKGPPPEAPRPGGAFLRQVLITVAILSVIANIAMVEKLFTMGTMMVALKKEVAAGRQDPLPPAKPPPVVREADLKSTPTPQELETALPKETELPPPPHYPEHRPQEATPPREEHFKSKGRPDQSSPSSRRVAQPAGDRRDDPHYNRLRRIDDIR